MMVAEPTRVAVYQLIYRLEWNFRYYASIADKLQRLSNRIRFTLLVGILAEALLVSPLGQFNWGWILILILGLLLAVLAIWDALSSHARDSGILKFTSFVCDELKTEAERLWRDLESNRIDTDEAESQYGSIVRQWGKATAKVLLATDNKLNVQCQKDAYQVMENQYGT